MCIEHSKASYKSKFSSNGGVILCCNKTVYPIWLVLAYNMFGFMAKINGS